MTLKLRIRELEAEVRGLRHHIEVIQGIALQVPYLHQEIEALKVENSRLNLQLSQMKLENSRLKEQLNTSEQMTTSKNEVTSLPLFCHFLKGKF